MGKKRKAPPKGSPVFSGGLALGRPEKRRAPGFGLELQNGGYRPTLSDVQNLIVRILTSEHGENPKWLTVRGLHLVRRIIVVVVPCLDAGTLRLHQEVAPTLTRLHGGQNGTATKSASEVEFYPGDQGISLAGCRLMRTLLSARAKPAVTCRRSPAAGPAEVDKKTLPPMGAYLATKEEMGRSGYPSHRDAGCGWLCIPTAAGQDEMPKPGTSSSEVHEESLSNAVGGALKDVELKNLVALDCEMVMTASGHALARVSMVNADRETLYDTFVVPSEEVTDYLTKFSGITPEILSDCKTSLSDVQAKLSELISSSTVLVGHSLENDFLALRLVHERVIDTCLLYPNARGWPHRNGLKGLCKTHLKRQLDREHGHDSVADALAALDLALLKFEKGPGYGASGGELVPLGRLLQIGGAALSVVDSKVWGDDGKARWHLEGCAVSVQADDVAVAAHVAAVAASAESPKALDAEAISPESATPDAAVAVKQLRPPPVDRKLQIVALRELETLRLAGTAQEQGSQSEGACIARLDQCVKQIACGVEDDELLIVLSGCGDLHRYSKLRQEAKECVNVDGSCEELKAKLKEVHKNFKDAFGIFVAGGAEFKAKLAEAVVDPTGGAPPRELVSYDF